jgi:hypothetical protein
MAQEARNAVPTISRTCRLSTEEGLIQPPPPAPPTPNYYDEGWGILMATGGEFSWPLTATMGPDGALRRAVTVWVVQYGDDLYVRSCRGRDSIWFRNAHARGVHGNRLLANP